MVACEALIVSTLVFGATDLGKIAVAPAQIDGDLGGLPPEVLDDTLLAAVQNTTGARVIGQNDIKDMIGFESSRQLLGCDDASCLANLGNTLGVDRIVVVSIGTVAGDWVVISKLINNNETRVESRTSDFVVGGTKALLQALPGVVKKLFEGGGVAIAPQSTGTEGDDDPGEPAAAINPQAIVELNARLAKQAAELWPQGDREIALNVGPTLVTLATVRLKIARASQAPEIFSTVRTGCTMKKQASACVEAADRLLTSHGISHSLQQAGDNFRLACKNGDEAACTAVRALVGSLFSIRGRHNKTTAGHLLVKMCLDGLADTCEHVAELAGEAGVDAMASACDQQENAQACAAVVARQREWRIGKNQRYLGYGCAAGSVAAAGLAALAFKQSNPSTSPMTYVFVSVGALGASIYFLATGIGSVYDARELAAEYGDSAETSVVPLMVETPELTYTGVGLQLIF